MATKTPKKLLDAVRFMEAIESGDATGIGSAAAELIVANNPKYAAAGPLIALGITKVLRRAAGEGGGWLSWLFGR